MRPLSTSTSGPRFRTMQKKFFSLLLLLLTSFGLPASANAGDVFLLRERSAIAEFSSENGSIVTIAFLVAAKERLHNPPNMKSSGPFAFVAIVKFDTSGPCGATLLMDAFGLVSLADQDFLIDRQLTSATLSPVTIPVQDFVSGGSFNVEVAMRWAGSGETVRQKDRFQVLESSFSFKSRFDGVFREASASGTISDGTTDYATFPLDFAELGSLKIGEVEITH
jgi:hypothetical protein